ncbi:MAG: endonuclease domain-containing protein, partial [Oscillospiraceae bacterium]|nr:endonuclease domain-containing protein [Oscillospiraceae bacterium]
RIVGQYILDFYCPKAKLAVELDGLQHYKSDAVEYDKIRTEFLNKWGIRVIRFANSEVEKNFDDVCRVISGEAQPPPSADGTPFTEGG